MMRCPPRPRQAAGWPGLGRALVAAALTVAASAVTMPAVAEDTLGRLFLTPAERRAIDAALTKPADASSAALQGGATALPPEPTRVDGVVRRSLGLDVVWIDGRPTVLDPDGGPARPRIEADQVVLPTADGRWLRLRPGPSIEGGHAGAGRAE